MESAQAHGALMALGPRCPECERPINLFLRVEKYGLSPAIEAYRRNT
jgi:hypothetical protein